MLMYTADGMQGHTPFVVCKVPFGSTGDAKGDIAHAHSSSFASSTPCS